MGSPLQFSSRNSHNSFLGYGLSFLFRIKVYICHTSQYNKLHFLSRDKVLVTVILKMEAVEFLEVLVTVYQLIRHNILQP
jgi:hypothetical protein